MHDNRITLKHLLVFLSLWLVITQSFSWLAFNRLRITEPDKKDYSPEVGYRKFKPHPLNFLEMHARQDSAWYLSIAEGGYKFSKSEQSNVNFFPLYPLLMKYGQEALKPLTPSLSSFRRYILSGTLISLISLFLGVIVLYNLFRLDGDSKTAFLAIFLFLIFPTSYFLTAVYTESLFLFLSALSFYFARKNRFFWAGVAGYFSALTRPVGIFLLIPLGIELFLQRRTKKFKGLLLDIVSLSLILLGLLTFMYYLNQRLNNPFLFLEAAKQWGRAFSSLSLWEHIRYELSFTQASAANILLELFFLAFGIIVSFFVFKKERFSYGIWCLISVVLPLTTGVLVSQGRYTLVLFPLFLTLARLIRNNLFFYHVYVLISLPLFGLLTVLFVNGHWSF